MKNVFCFIFLCSSVCLAENGTQGYSQGFSNLTKACLEKETKTEFCQNLKYFKSNVEEFGEEVTQTLAKKIDMPVVTFAGSFAIKTLIEKKVVIDPKLNNYWNPRLEIAEDKTVISFHTELPF